MKLAVSNVAWYPREVDGFLKLLAELGCDGVELAASMIWEEPASAPKRERDELRKKIQDAGLRLTGFQALIYSRPDLVLFKDAATREKALEYFARLMDLCAELGGEVLVFGSPRNRNIGDVPRDEAWKTAAEFFRRVGERAVEKKVFFCIEPLARNETDFINSVAEAEKLIADAGAPPGLGLHVDIKALIEAEEVGAPYLPQSFAKAKHVHVNDPGLKPPGSTGYDHRPLRDLVRNSGYSRFMSIEMRRQEPDVEGTVRRAVDYVRKVYF